MSGLSIPVSEYQAEDISQFLFLDKLLRGNGKGKLEE